MPNSSDTSIINQPINSRFESLINDLKQRFPARFLQNQSILIVSVVEQKLYLYTNQKLVKYYLISSAEAGTGNLSGSYQTPLGIHQISEKFGADAQFASIFKARKNTHQIAEILHDPSIRSDFDNITSRILWLDGLEEGVNKGLDKNNNNVDSHQRYIYIHGTDEEGLLGEAASHGCVRMANKDVIELFESVEIGVLVVITEE